MHELPDMFSVHLMSAKTLLKTFLEQGCLEEISVALSVTMLSVSALEAFINQVVYFLGTSPALPRYIRDKVPEILKTDYESYQRNSRLQEKLGTVFDLIYNETWKKEQEHFSNVTRLITIRNELVHFKARSYQQIIPPQSENILKGLDTTIDRRYKFLAI